MLNQLKAQVNNGTLTLFLYGDIGDSLFGDSTTAKSVSDEVKTAGEFDRIELRINSYGGDPFEATAIKNYLRSLGKPITAYVDAVAASAATILALAGDAVIMGEGSFFMIHNIWTIVMGNATELRKWADDLEKMSNSIAELYAKRSGLPVEEVQKMMDAETWFTADEAVDKGFANSVDAKKNTRAAAAGVYMIAFKNVPDALKSYTPTTSSVTWSWTVPDDAQPELDVAEELAIEQARINIARARLEMEAQ